MRRIARNIVEEEEEVDTSSFSVSLSEDTSSFHPQQEGHPDEMQIEEEEVKILDISEEEINQIYSRLPQIASKSDDRKDFHMREPSLKPNIKHVIPKAFPPKEETEPIKEEYNSHDDLTILRYAPENSVEIASHLTITFSHPMISISTLDQIAQQQIPVEITPKVEGKFRYVGTKTILFEPSYRFPMSTIFTVEVPKGTKSILGNELKESFTFKFTTPPPTLKRNRVIGNTRKPFLFAQFDQEISPHYFVSQINVKSNGEVIRVPFRLVEEKDYLNHKEEKSIKGLIKSADAKRFLLFVVDNDQLLPHDSDISIIFPSDLGSEEGPLRTTNEQSFNFRTYGPLVYTNKSEGVYPGDAWYINFSNPLDEEVDISELISISPPLDGAQITWSSSNINIKGKSKGSITYKVGIKKELRDIYSQTLNEDLELEIAIKEAKTHLYPFVADQIVFLKPEPGVHYSVIAVNLESIDVTFFQVNPDEVLNVEHNQWRKFDAEKTFENVSIGKMIETISLPVQNYERDTPIEVKIPLAIGLTYPDENLGHVILCISTPDGVDDKITIYAYCQVTNIGISAFQLEENLSIWATELSTNKPIPNLKIQTPLFSGTTDELGVVNYSLLVQSQPWIRSSLGNDHLTYRLNAHHYSGYGDRFLCYITDDRRLYKPKEEVHIAGWVRKIQKGTYLLHDIPKGMEIDYNLNDSQGIQIATGKLELNSFGSFTLAITLPDNVNLGHAHISFSNQKHQFNQYHSIKIEEFRTPEFSIVVNADSSPKYTNSNTVVSVSASYFSGGGLDDSDVTWTASGTESSYSPPNWGEYNFSPDNHYFRPYCYPQPKSIKASVIKSKTDTNGNNEILVSFAGSLDIPKPVTVNMAAVVQDINRQTISGSTSFIVHPCRYYIGVKVDKKIVGFEEKSSFHLVVTDIDGNIIPDVDINVSIQLFVEKIRNGKQYDEKEEKFSNIIKSQNEPSHLEVNLLDSGSYSITSRIKDNFGNEIFSNNNFWITTGDAKGIPKRNEHFEIITDKTEYSVGDEITLMAQSPLQQTRGWVYTVARNVLKKEYFELEDGQSTYVYKHKVAEEEVPYINFYFEIIGYKVGANEQLIPAYKSGVTVVTISLNTRSLTVNLKPHKKILTPGEETTIDVNVQFSDSSLPVQNAEILLIVVDEAILSLTPETRSKDQFIRSFYSQFNSNLARYDSRGEYYNPDWRFISFLRPEILMKRFARGGMMRCMAFDGMAESCMSLCSASSGGKASQPRETIAVRSNFNPLALFASNLITDQSGKASATFKLPDNLTAYRVIAFTTHEAKYFGKSESSIQVKLPLMIRPSLPRFLNFGDETDLPLVIQNQSEDSIQAKLVIRTTNLNVTSVKGVQLNIPPNKRTEYRFKAKTENVGLAKLQFGITSSCHSDAIEKEFNVWTPATTEGFATYGEIDANPDSILQLITKPRGVFSQFGGLSVSLSSTALQGLLDAVDYIIHYPFECTEQLASRLLTLISTKDILHAFNSPKIPPVDEVKEIISSAIKLLQKRQNNNGGFGWWNANKSEIYLSIFVTLALSRYHREDLPIDSSTAEMINKAKNYISNIDIYFEEYHSPSTRIYLKAFSYYILSTFGDDVSVKATALYNENKEKLSLEVLGWTLLSIPNDSPLVKDILRFLSNRINETAETANFVSQYSDSSEERHVLLCSNTKTDAILLEALIKCDPSNSVIAKLVKGVLGARRKGRWYNTQDNCFALISILTYFRNYENIEPNFNAKVWLDNNYAGSQEFKGRSVDTHLIEIPMDFILQQKEEENGLTLAKEGDGRLYYRIGLDYALTSFELSPLSAGFAITRTYTAVDNNDDVKLEEGVWKVKSGARVKVTLSIFNQSQRFHVAMVDKLPAAFEVLNPALKTTEKLPNAENPILFGCYWLRNWFDHQNMRDERVEAFATYLYPGVHEFSYYARATTHGSFIAPPSKIEEMYSPEVFGRYKNEKVIVV